MSSTLGLHPMIKSVAAALLVLACASAAARSVSFAFPPTTGTVPMLALSDLRSTSVTAEERRILVVELRAKIDRMATVDVRTAPAEVFIGGLWAAGMLHDYGTTTVDAVRRVLRGDAPKGLDDPLVRDALEVAYAIRNPRAELGNNVSAFVGTSRNAKHSAMAALALPFLVGESSRGLAAEASDRLKSTYPEWKSHPILNRAIHDLSYRNRNTTTPLEELVAAPFPGNAVVGFSFQRQSYSYDRQNKYGRNNPGLTVVRGGDGRFVRQPGGSVFSIPHLARSDSDMPGYLSNGNTPQGVFTVSGEDISRGNKFIGNTPFLWTELPFEADAARYFHDPARAGTSWTLDMYKSLLPPNWRNHEPMMEAWYAGKAGRGEVIAHGTTIDPDYFKGQPWFPNSPSKGCLTALELWDPVTGQATHSDQAALINAWRTATGSTDGKGFFVVVEIPGEGPVHLYEVLPALMNAETK